MPGNEQCPICRGRGQWLLTECPNRVSAIVLEFVECAEDYMQLRVFPDGSTGRLNQPASFMEALKIYRRFSRA